MTGTWQRWAPVLGVLGVVAWIAAFVTGGKTPDPTASDAKIRGYFTSDSHQIAQIVAFLAIVVGAALLICFLANLRERLTASDADRNGQSLLMFGSAVASLVFWVMSAALLTLPGWIANSSGISTMSPDGYRLASDLGFQLWITAAVMSAVTVWTTSSLALQSAALPRWFAWAGIPVGIIQLGAVFVIPALIFWVWMLVAAVLLVVSRPRATTAVVPDGLAASG
jgi:hypothetical protein